MVCQSCGGPVQGAFCSQCGARAASAPPVYGAPPPAGVPPAMMYLLRVQRHLHSLGILWCVYGAYRAVTGIIGALVLAGIAAHGQFGGWVANGDLPFFPHPSWMAALVPVVVVYTLLSSALAFLTGFALMRRLPWGRTLAIVAGILALFKPLMGTALGIYTLWVLAPAASAMEYEALMDRG